MILWVFYAIYFVFVILFYVFFMVATYHFKKYDIKRTAVHPVLMIYFLLSIIVITITFIFSFT